MSDKSKFHNMTKPIPFRGVKKFFLSAKRTYEVGRNKINYLFSYLLYKLKIYKKFYYRDDVVSDYNLTPFISKDPNYFCKSVQGKHISAVVQIRGELHTYIHSEYFYREKKGVKVKKYVIVDHHQTHLMLCGSLHNIGVRFSTEESYHFANVPKYRVVEPPELLPSIYEECSPLTRPKYKTYIVDLSKISSQRIKYDTFCDKVAIDELKVRYDFFVQMFYNYVNSLSHKELFVEESHD